jgi:hypothetical protein
MAISHRTTNHVPLHLNYHWPYYIEQPIMIHLTFTIHGHTTYYHRSCSTSHTLYMNISHRTTDHVSSHLHFTWPYHIEPPIIIYPTYTIPGHIIQYHRSCSTSPTLYMTISYRTTGHVPPHLHYTWQYHIEPPIMFHLNYTIPSHITYKHQSCFTSTTRYMAISHRTTDHVPPHLHYTWPYQIEPPIMFHLTYTIINHIT